MGMGKSCFRGSLRQLAGHCRCERHREYFDRHGTRVDEISLRSQKPVYALEWDKDGECLAVLQEESGAIPIWDNTTRRVKRLETNLKDPTSCYGLKRVPVSHR